MANVFPLPLPGMLPEATSEPYLYENEQEGALDEVYGSLAGELAPRGYGHTREGPQPLTHDELASVVQQEIDSALGGLETEVSEVRRRMLNLYYGRPLGNEQEGRSKVIMTDVRDTIEWIMPSLVRMLLGGQYTVRYKAKNAATIDQADQATEVVKYILEHEADSYQTLSDWIKTALLERNGFAKAYYEPRVEPRVDVFEGLEDVQIVMLEQQGYQIRSATPRQEMRQDEFGTYSVVTYDVEAARYADNGGIRVVGVPPEEFLIARRAITLDDRTPFCAHRVKYTVSDLIAMGFPEEVVWNLPSDDLPEYVQERVERRLEEESYPYSSAERVDGASREIWVTECYIRVDEDGDGFAELRKITVAGESPVTILGNERINHVPIAALKAIPVPHKFFGLSVAELVEDLQVIRSTILRQMLDNLYLINNGRYEVVQDEVEIDDLLESRPGGVVRVTQPGMVNPIQTQPLPPAAFNMMEFLESVKENRTGVLRYANGMDSSVLHDTASGVSTLMNAAQARVELIARGFAKTGFKRLGKILLSLIKSAPMKERVIKLRGEWVTVDPSTWNEDMDVEIEVGLGVGQANERMQRHMMIMDLQKQMVENGLGAFIKPDHVYSSFQKLLEAMDEPVPERYMDDPNGQLPPPPPPPEKIQLEQMRQEMEGFKLQLAQQQLAADANKEAALAEHRAEELSLQTEIKLAEIQSRERVEMAKIRASKEAAEEETNDEERE